jgi:hypothetical protein
LGAIFLALPLKSQSVVHLSIIQPGGMPGLPVMIGITDGTNSVTMTWDGPSGYYQLYQKSNSLGAAWVAFGKPTNLMRYAVVSKLFNNGFFRVSGPSPLYAGAPTCADCHQNIYQTQTNTPHAMAFQSLQAVGQYTNADCLACHTVGYGLPTGFIYTNGMFLNTYLEGVQCENCHGPAGNHAANPADPTVVPRVELAAQVCGGCHSGPQTPTYDEWSTSGHATVTPDALAVINSSTNNINGCGVCHSGSVRLALIQGENPAVTLTNDVDVAITCAVCHDPHATNVNPAQLRNPMFSTNDFHFVSTNIASVAAFTNSYEASADINLCAHCHNDRGAAWTDTSRAPHRSLQYNFLLGTVGELAGGEPGFDFVPHVGLPSSTNYSISGTFYLTNQCAACHMQADAPPACGNSHALTVSYTVCANCHDGQAAQAALTPLLSNQVAAVISGLNEWAARQAPPQLITNGVVPWEYSTAGGLTWQTNSSGAVTGWSLQDTVNFSGPNAAGQALIPDTIKQARFDLYLVVSDGSMGVHNPFYALELLSSAQEFILEQLEE